MEMKDTACNNDDNPACIFSYALEQLDDFTQAHLQSASVCKGTIRNQRLAEFPPVPATLRELVIVRYGEWGMTCEQNQHTTDNGQESDSYIAFGKDKDMQLCTSRR